MSLPDMNAHLTKFSQLLKEKSAIARALASEKFNKAALLIPYAKNHTAEESPYYDYPGFRELCDTTFADLKLPYEWVKISMATMNDDISSLKRFDTKTTVFVNLCDGDEINGYPGKSVLSYLSAQKLFFTGAGIQFYELSTSKIAMKNRLFKANVSSADWFKIDKDNYTEKEMAFLSFAPFIVKPDVSFGSYGIEKSSVVHSAEELNQRIKAIRDSAEGLEHSKIRLYAEEFVLGPEFTVFVTGSKAQQYLVWPALERVFHNSLAEDDKFVTYERAAHTYNKEAMLENNVPYYNYEAAGPITSDELKEIAEEACAAVNADGYCRVDIRQNAETGQYYVLEVNANCGISAETDNALGVLLKSLSLKFSDLMAILIHNSIER